MFFPGCFLVHKQGEGRNKGLSSHSLQSAISLCQLCVSVGPRANGSCAPPSTFSLFPSSSKIRLAIPRHKHTELDKQGVAAHSPTGQTAFSWFTAALRLAEIREALEPETRIVRIPPRICQWHRMAWQIPYTISKPSELPTAAGTTCKMVLLEKSTLACTGRHLVAPTPETLPRRPVSHFRQEGRHPLLRSIIIASAAPADCSVQGPGGSTRQQHPFPEYENFSPTEPHEPCKQSWGSRPSVLFPIPVNNEVRSTIEARRQARGAEGADLHVEGHLSIVE